MLYLTLFALLLALSRYLNSLRVSNAALELEYKFAALNSELNLLVIEGEISPNNDNFSFLSNSLTHSVPVLKKINFWVFVLMAFKTRKDKQENYADFEKQFTNPKVKSILNQYTMESSRFFRSKNYFAINTFLLFLKLYRRCSSIFNAGRDMNFVTNFQKNFKLLLLKQEQEKIRYCYNEPMAN